ncbi:hypothetical protein [Gemmobacter sp. 24YEA27]|uniref:hypothetical protein n=1 Tax=Gemmobacter sp. 24YEA27 TaxID=3040672 RepID=UPI0024B3C8C2|nr:hypothetical protein [Gemmobacter sp. 24YEA27]
MDKDLRIIELERELADTRRAAVSIIMGMAEGIAPSAEGRAELAKGFREAADDPAADPATARLALLVAMELERR